VQQESELGFLGSLGIAHRHLDALRSATSSAVHITRMRSTIDGWVIAYRVGDGKERAFIVGARDRALHGVEPALAGPPRVSENAA
jgi:hypothetical protein